MEHTYTLSRAHTVRLRGILACCVILCHLLDTPWAYRVIPSSVVGALGYFSVACFFFLSGYGLTVQYRRRGEQYLASFPRSRLLPFWLLTCGLAVLYTLLTLITNNEPITPSLLLQTLTFGPDTIISKGWYLQVALICYIAFYVVFRFVPSGLGRFAVGCGLLVLYIAVCAAWGFSVSYYQTVSNFLLGCVWHRLMAEKPRLRLAVVLGCLWGVIWVASIYTAVGSIALRGLSTILFAALVAELLEKLPLMKIPFLDALGEISFELYVIHGFFLILYRKGIVISNEVLYILAVVISSVICAMVIHPVVQKLYALCRRDSVEIKS